jgi:hypothetical protein
MYSTGLLGSHAYEMSLDKHNFFGLVRFFLPFSQRQHCKGNTQL